MERPLTEVMYKTLQAAIKFADILILVFIMMFSGLWGY